jgi:hypothetical protein
MPTFKPVVCPKCSGSDVTTGYQCGPCFSPGDKDDDRAHWEVRPTPADENGVPRRTRCPACGKLRKHLSSRCHACGHAW